jgi:hypothetical protein
MRAKEDQQRQAYRSLRPHLHAATKIRNKHEDLRQARRMAKRVNKCIEGFKMKAFDLQRELMNDGKGIEKRTHH